MRDTEKIGSTNQWIVGEVPTFVPRPVPMNPTIGGKHRGPRRPPVGGQSPRGTSAKKSLKN